MVCPGERQRLLEQAREQDQTQYQDVFGETEDILADNGAGVGTFPPSGPPRIRLLPNFLDGSAFDSPSP